MRLQAAGGNSIGESPEGDPLVGRVLIGSYRVEAKIAHGGMATVYRLRHERLPETFAALKVLGHGPGGGGVGPTARERFEQEALAAATVGAGRVARPLDVGQLDDGTPYIVMEYVAGLTLAEELARRGAFDAVAALAIAWRIADAMAIAHARAIVHRDLKPSNVMLADDGGVKLLDFGVARATGAIKLAHTGERALLGTLGYLAPEGVAALPVDERADVFSVGAMLYEMLAGAPAFPQRDAHAVAVATLTEEPPGFERLRPAALDPVAAGAEALVRRTLAKEPSRRPTMAELRDELAGLLGEACPAAQAAPTRDRVVEREARSDVEDRLAAIAERLRPGAAAAATGTRDERGTVWRRRPRARLGVVALALLLVGASIAAAVARAHRGEPAAAIARATPTSALPPAAPTAAARAAPTVRGAAAPSSPPPAPTASTSAPRRRRIVRAAPPRAVRVAPPDDDDAPKDQLD